MNVTHDNPVDEGADNSALGINASVPERTWIGAPLARQAGFDWLRFCAGRRLGVRHDDVPLLPDFTEP
jgi:hypothetical protein